MEQNEAKILHQLGGTVEQISRDLAEFAESARVLSHDHPRFIDAYPEQWVAVYQGHVAAQGDSLEAATQDAMAKGLPMEHLLVRHITRDEKIYFF